jgi:PAS domain S-box-containing protein
VPRATVTGFVVLFVMLVGIGLLSDLHIRTLDANAERVADSHKTIDAARDTLRVLVDAETGQRGYLLTGDPTYLTPYNDARMAIAGRLDELAGRVDADHRPQVDRLRELADAKLREIDETLRLRDGPGGLTAALVVVHSDKGLRTMRQLRATVDELVGAEQELLDRRSAESDASASTARWTLAAVTATAALLVIAAAGLVARDAALRKTATDARERQLAAERAEADAGARRFRVMAEAMPQMIWTARPDGDIDYCNRQWYAYTGVPEGQPHAWGWSKALHPDDRERTVALWQHAVATGGDYDIEYRFRRHDGAYRWFIGRASPVCDREGRITQWVGTCTDIDDQKRSRDQLETLVREATAELVEANARLRDEVAERRRAEARALVLNAELERSNRALQDFASVASHDLQEPLRKIQAFGDRLAVRCADQLGEPGRDYLGRITSAAGRMSVLINDLLAFSRVTSKAKPFARVDLNTVAREVVGDLEARVRQTGGRVEVGELPAVEADPTQMRQLLQNLIANGLKFHRKGEPPRVRVSGEAAGGVYRLTVSDNGIGFDEKYLPRIFDVFQRLHGRDEYEGTGIGLAICRKIVERHGGTITAHSRPGQGATFVVTLPMRPAPAPVEVSVP